MLKGIVARMVLFICVMILIAGKLSAQPSNRYAVVITEIYPDPDPRSRLPGFEYVELKNVSGTTINLKGWRLSDGTNTGLVTASVEIKPDSFLIICAPSAVTSLRPYGAVLGLSGFPSLNNDEDNLTLYDPHESIIHHIHYYSSWYQNDIKKQGGWSLEMIDPLNFCGAGSNYKASENENGGTPGSTNSLNASNPDDQPPGVVRTYLKDSQTIVVVFDEMMDSSSSANLLGYRLQKGDIKISRALPLAPGFEQVELLLSSPLEPGIVHQLNIKDIRDCTGNSIGSRNEIKVGRSSPTAKNDIIINEILFNPSGNGYDYVEIYNRSKKIINLKDLFVASRSAIGTLGNIAAVTNSPGLLFPGEYLVITEDRDWLQQHYSIRQPETVSVITDLPSMPDDRGNLTLTDNRGSVIDELNYSEKWHFALMSNVDGVALERIDVNEPGNDKSNWISASSAAGFGTPGYQNSQFRADLLAKGSFIIEPKIFSPDNDGFEDLAGMRYEMAQAGYMGNITIYDAIGRPVRYLVKSALLGMKGVYNWDGLDENQKKLPVGIYIAFMEVFNLDGRVKKIKNTITLARKF